MKKLIVVVVAGLMLQACSWVRLTPEGEKTRVLSRSEVTACKKLGRTTSSIKADIAGLDRSPEKVREELEILARNTAPDMDGDTVVPIGKPEDGSQVFEVYRCVDPDRRDRR
jgi:hypothetical protein